MADLRETGIRSTSRGRLRPKGEGRRKREALTVHSTLQISDINHFNERPESSHRRRKKTWKSQVLSPESSYGGLAVLRQHFVLAMGLSLSLLNGEHYPLLLGPVQRLMVPSGASGSLGRGA